MECRVLSAKRVQCVPRFGDTAVPIADTCFWSQSPPTRALVRSTAAAPRSLRRASKFELEWLQKPCLSLLPSLSSLLTALFWLLSCLLSLLPALLPAAYATIALRTCHLELCIGSTTFLPINLDPLRLHPLPGPAGCPVRLTLGKLEGDF